MLRSAVLTGVSGAALTGNALGAEGSSSTVLNGPYADDAVIREDYWIETTTDTDGTGDPDRIHVEIARPESTETEALPVIMEASPYFGGFVDDLYAPPHDMETELYRPGETTADETVSRTDELLIQSEDDLAEFTGSDNPNWIGPSQYEELFLQQGYVFAYASALGTGESTGCTTTGDDRELAAFEAIIDWFNGRADAYDSKVGGQQQSATFTDGATGMIGVSYNGTIPNGLATRGIEGLKTIVPIVAISSWYDYYRSEGAVITPGGRGRASAGPDTDYMAATVLTREDPERCYDAIDQLTDSQDRLTGNYSSFWEDRNYVPDADNVDIPVLLTHGLDDYNVKMRHARQWLDALKNADVPYHVWLHQGGHDDPIDLHQSQWIDFLDDWWAQWLKGADRGVLEGPNATIQRRGDSGEPEDWPLEQYDDYPSPEAAPVTVDAVSNGAERGDLVLDAPDDAIESLVDDSEQLPLSLFDADESGNRLLYTTDQLTEAVRLSGRPQLSLSVEVDDEVGLLSAALIDYDESGTPYDVNRGWMNLQNRTDRETTEPIEPGERYEVDLSVHSVDHVFEEGHRIGIAIYSTDYNFTKRTPSAPELTVSLADSSFELPVVGGEAALESALLLDCDSYREELRTEDGEIPTDGVRSAVEAWSNGDLGTNCLTAIIDEWAS